MNKVTARKKEIIREVTIEKSEISLKFLKKLTENRLSIKRMTTEMVGSKKSDELLTNWDDPQGSE